ncbi:MAG: type secretion protein [Pseudomonadota bacterium]|jgi:type VI secretion system VasD/TssJ family lipoprotein
MNLIIKNFILILFLLFAFGCSKKEPAPQKSSDELTKEKPPVDAPKPDFIYSENSLMLNYKASSRLNYFNDSAHTLMTVVYQLSTPDEFLNLAKTKNGIKKLLQATEFDSSVVSATTMIIQPSAEKNVTTYRAKNAQWVGIVGGYYEFSPNMSVSLQKIPVKYTKHGVWPFSSYTTNVLDLTINIDFYELSLQTKGFIDANN